MASTIRAAQSRYSKPSSNVAYSWPAGFESFLPVWLKPLHSHSLFLCCLWKPVSESRATRRYEADFRLLAVRGDSVATIHGRRDHGSRKRPHILPLWRAKVIVDFPPTFLGPGSLPLLISLSMGPCLQVSLHVPEGDHEPMNPRESGPRSKPPPPPSPPGPN